MLHLNSTTLSQVVNSAKLSAADHPRWITAINRAVVELESNPYLERQGSGLLIGSPSGQVYSSNGTCGCCSYTGLDNGKRIHAGGFPCWHRACARLVRLHDEAEARKAAQRPSYDLAAREMAELFA